MSEFSVRAGCSRTASSVKPNHETLLKSLLQLRHTCPMPGLSFRAAPALPAPWGWAGCAEAAAAFSLHGLLQTRAGGNSPGSCSQAPNVSFLNPLPVPGRSPGHLPVAFLQGVCPREVHGDCGRGEQCPIHPLRQPAELWCPHTRGVPGWHSLPGGAA